MEFRNFIYLEDDLKDLILSWRNDERVRSQMVTTDEISKEDHYNFIENLKNDNHNRYFLAIADKPLGVTYLNNINGKTSEIGIYLDPNEIGKGFGEKIFDEFINTLFFDVLTLKVRKTNISAIALYEKFGFEKKSEDEEFFFYSDDIFS